MVLIYIYMYICCFTSSMFQFLWQMYLLYTYKSLWIKASAKLLNALNVNICVCVYIYICMCMCMCLLSSMIVLCPSQADIRPQTDGCNGLRYNLTPDIIESIFRTYPAGEKRLRSTSCEDHGEWCNGQHRTQTFMCAVRVEPRAQCVWTCFLVAVQQKYGENVPHNLTEKEFWTRFFQSHYFHRDRISTGALDIFSECAKQDDKGNVTHFELYSDRYIRWIWILYIR